MRRRNFHRILGGTALLWPIAGRAHEPLKRRMIATLTVGSAAAGGPLIATFREALATVGYGADKVTVESRWADGHGDRLPALAAELVRLSPAVLLAAQSVSAVALKQATATTPIVFAVSDDPVGIGLVPSLANPGGNITGMSFVQLDTVGKQLQLLATMVPGAGRVAVLTNPGNPQTKPILKALDQAAPQVPVKLVAAMAGSPEEIASAFATIEGEHAAAVLVLGDGLFTSERRRVVALAARQRLPALYHDRIIVKEGGLMSYGPDLADNYKGAALLVAKILNGAKPGDLPVAEPTKFYLCINGKTAASLGLTVPQSLLARADEVIE